jgi:kynurenine formamidase
MIQYGAMRSEPLAPKRSQRPAPSGGGARDRGMAGRRCRGFRRAPRAGRALLALPALLLGCRTPAPAWPAGEVVDLTHPFDEQTIYWPTDRQGFVLESLSAGVTPQGYYYTANRFCAAEHGGTHIDAPVHFGEGRPTLDEIPVEKLLGPGALVDVSPVAARDPDYQVSASDFEAWEARHGPLPEGSIVLLRTGYGRYWGDRARYLGTQRTGPEAVPDLHFPGLDPDAARWLAERRSIAAIGLDTPSIDRGQSTLFESHRILFEREIPVFENLAQLEALPETDFFVVALPMKIRGGSGGPLRAIAILPGGAGRQQP